MQNVVKGLVGKYDYRVSLEVGRNFWAALRKAKVVCSIFEYLVSASAKALLT